MKFTNKVAEVTGAAGGPGQAIALADADADAGATLDVCDINTTALEHPRHQTHEIEEDNG